MSISETLLDQLQSFCKECETKNCASLCSTVENIITQLMSDLFKDEHEHIFRRLTDFQDKMAARSVLN